MVLQPRHLLAGQELHEAEVDAARFRRVPLQRPAQPRRVAAKQASRLGQVGAGVDLLVEPRQGQGEGVRLETGARLDGRGEGQPVRLQLGLVRRQVQALELGDRLVIGRQHGHLAAKAAEPSAEIAQAGGAAVGSAKVAAPARHAALDEGALAGAGRVDADHFGRREVLPLAGGIVKEPGGPAIGQRAKRLFRVALRETAVGRPQRVLLAESQAAVLGHPQAAVDGRPPQYIARLIGHAAEDDGVDDVAPQGCVRHLAVEADQRLERVAVLDVQEVVVARPAIARDHRLPHKPAAAQHRDLLELLEGAGVVVLAVVRVDAADPRHGNGERHTFERIGLCELHDRFQLPAIARPVDTHQRQVPGHQLRELQGRIAAQAVGRAGEGPDGQRARRRRHVADPQVEAVELLDVRQPGQVLGRQHVGVGQPLAAGRGGQRQAQGGRGQRQQTSHSVYPNNCRVGSSVMVLPSVAIARGASA